MDRDAAATVIVADAIATCPDGHPAAVMVIAAASVVDVIVAAITTEAGVLLVATPTATVAAATLVSVARWDQGLQAVPVGQIADPAAHAATVGSIHVLQIAAGNPAIGYDRFCEPTIIL